MRTTPPLAQIVRQCLSQPPSRVGCRMRPERELAEAFGISRRKVREAIDDLVEAQVLVREHGSGVYVRKIPALVANDVSEESIDFEKLFVREKAPARLQIPDAKRGLVFEVWWKSGFNNETASLFKKGLKDQAASLGHKLLLHEHPSGKETSEIAAEIRAELGKRRCDGYIIHVPFAQAFDQIDDIASTPLIYVSTGLQPLKHQPMIRFDGIEATERAITLLAEQGFCRIGCLGFKSPYGTPDEHLRREAAELMIQKLGLPLKKIERVPLEEGPIAAALERLLRGKEPCDALYITDDYLLRMAVPMMERLGLRPGRDLGAIVLSNRGSQLPEGYEWSRIEFDPYNNGKLAITCLIRSVESAGEELLSFSHHPAWRPGQTHLRP